MVNIKEPEQSETQKKRFQMPNIRLPSFSKKKSVKEEEKAEDDAPKTPPPSPIEGAAEGEKKSKV